MKILFLNCAGRKNVYVNSYIKKNNIDIAILAESKNIRNKMSREYKNSFISTHNYGISIITNQKIKVSEVDYIINDDELKKLINIDNQKERILDISIKNYHILAVHIDYGFYNLFAMNAIKEYLKNHKIDIIIGDFNSGYLNDNLDYKNGGILFQNGYLYFRNYEDMGYVNMKKNCGIYSFESKKSKRKFRIDHCFVKDKKVNVEYIDEFLELKVSDHKGILLEL